MNPESILGGIPSLVCFSLLRNPEAKVLKVKGKIKGKLNLTDLLSFRVSSTTKKFTNRKIVL